MISARMPYLTVAIVEQDAINYANGLTAQAASESLRPKHDMLQ